MNGYFTISYYEGEGEALPLLPSREFHTIKGAADWCTEHEVPWSVVDITEWDRTVIDAYGVPEIIGNCNLQEAVECEYENLSFNRG